MPETPSGMGAAHANVALSECMAATNEPVPVSAMESSGAGLPVGKYVGSEYLPATITVPSLATATAKPEAPDASCTSVNQMPPPPSASAAALPVHASSPARSRDAVAAIRKCGCARALMVETSLTGREQ